MFSDYQQSFALAIYAVVGGFILGLVLAATRAHMTARATLFFTMLYYFLFTGFINAHRFFFDREAFTQASTTGFARALIFALSAAFTVGVIRWYQRRKFKAYLHDLEKKCDC